MRTYITLLLLTLPLLAQQPVKLTLAEAEAEALKRNPSVSATFMDAAAANQVTLEVRSGLFPTLTGSITGAASVTGSSLAAGALTNSSVYDRLAAGAAVSQLITDFGRTSNLTSSARFRAEARNQAAKATRADIVLQVDRAYFSALRASAVIQVARETVRARQLVADQAEALANAKLKSTLDVTFAKVNLSDAKLLLLDAENVLKAAYAELSNALGYREPQTFELTNVTIAEPPPTDIKPLIDLSQQRRPELLSARADVDAARKFTLAEKDLAMPTISAVAAGGGVPAHETALHGRYLAAGLNVNIPILNGHLFSARRTEAEYRAQAAEQLMHAIENRIARDVGVAFLNVSTAYQRLALTVELLEQASQSMQLAQARYDLGLGSIVELSQAQLNFTSAQIANTSAGFEYSLQRSVLDYQTGAPK